MFTAFFPSEPLPDNPWVDEELLDTMIAWQQFTEQEWLGIRDTLYQQLPESLRNQEGSTREFTDMVLETFKTGVIEQRISDRRRAVSPDSSHRSSTSTSNATGSEQPQETTLATIPKSSILTFTAGLNTPNAPEVSERLDSFPEGDPFGVGLGSFTDIGLDSFKDIDWEPVTNVDWDYFLDADYK
jgi:hypothetical protein